MPDSVRLGSFRLEEPLSSGGMGTVWRAVHEATGTPVAVKVIAAAYARNPLYLDGFEREVRAVARMEHPRIIKVYDYGIVDGAADRESQGRLPRGAPWLAMELATRGSLAALGGVGDWPTLKTILFDVLDALAHSHARQIVHRDLKPGNILLAQTPDGVHCKLTDYGIAHASGKSMSTREVFATSAGTPWYMAPEQVESRWRDYGPWTDLYALGCVAYQLAGGVTPFVGESAVRVARQQLFDRAPPLEPRFEVPPGFKAWVERLLVKEIPHRFRRAADAAWALHQISPREDTALKVTRTAPSPPVGSTTDLLEVAGVGTITTDPSPHSEVATLTFLSQRPRRSEQPTPVPAFSFPGQLLTFSVPPMPQSWKSGERPKVGSLVGAGLGLFRLREIPFVGRETERDRLWEILRDVVTHRRPRVLVVFGEAGMGKSRLSRWMSERAHELGVSSSLVAQHSPVRGPTHGLGSMLQRYLGCGGLDFERTYLRIRRLITTQSTASPDTVAYYSAALATIIHGGGEAPGVPIVRFANEDERHQVVKWALQQISDRRPAMLVFDDVQWGYDAIELTKRIAAGDQPVLCVLSVSEEQLSERPLERDALRELMDDDDVEVIRLGPISRDEHLELVDELLALEPALRERVLEKTFGSPLFAAELIGDWIQRGLLEAGPEGFRLVRDVAFPLDLHALWNDRLNRVLHLLEDPTAARAAVEVGAALGTTVMVSEWHEACRKLGIQIDVHLLDVLAEHGLVEPAENGWAFRHQLLRESIARAAKEAGRASKQHRVVSELLEFDDSADSQFRRALHCLAVDDYAGAARPLLEAMKGMMTSGRMREATAIANFLDDVGEHLPPDAPIRAAMLEQRMTLLSGLGDYDELFYLGARMRPVAEEHGWFQTLAAIDRNMGGVEVERGNATEGRALVERSLDLARRAKDPETLALSHQKLGWLEVRFGDLDSARAHFEAARDHFQIASDAEGESSVIGALAEVERNRQNLDAARAYNEEAIELARRFGHRSILVNHLIRRGEIAMASGDYREASHCHEEARTLAQITTNPNLPVTELNLGIAKLYLGHARQARELISSACDAFDDRNWQLYSYFAGLGLLWCAAALGDRAEWDLRYPRMAKKASQDFAFRESVEHAVSAGDQWMMLGDPRRATESFKLALAMIPLGYADELGPMVRDRLQAAKHVRASDEVKSV